MVARDFNPWKRIQAIPIPASRSAARIDIVAIAGEIPGIEILGNHRAPSGRRGFALALLLDSSHRLLAIIRRRALECCSNHLVYICIHKKQARLPDFSDRNALEYRS
jgi:hypothetical protein